MDKDYKKILIIISAILLGLIVICLTIVTVVLISNKENRENELSTSVEINSTTSNEIAQYKNFYNQYKKDLLKIEKQASEKKVDIKKGLQETKDNLEEYKKAIDDNDVAAASVWDDYVSDSIEELNEEISKAEYDLDEDKSGKMSKKTKKHLKY